MIMVDENLKNQGEYDIRANIMLNTECNFRCPYCYVSLKARKDKSRYLPAEKMLGLFEKSGKTWYVKFSGGEPFLYPNFISLCKKITEKHYLNINTNLSSSLVYRFIEEMDISRVEMIVCSLHLTELERLGLIEEFIQKVKLLKEKKFNYLVSFVMWPPYIKKIKKLYEKFAAQGIFIYPVAFRGYYKNKKYPESYTEHEKELIEYYFKLHKKNQEKKNLIIKQRNIKTYTKTINNEIRGLLSFKGVPCQTGKYSIVIFSNGDVRRCGTDRSISLGNLYEDNIKLLNTTLKCNAPICNCFYQGLYYALGDPKIVNKNEEKVKQKKLLGMQKINEIGKKLNLLRKNLQTSNN